MFCIGLYSKYSYVDIDLIFQMAKAIYDCVSPIIPEIKNVNLTELSDFIGADGDLFTDAEFQSMAARLGERYWLTLAASYTPI